MTVTVTVPLRRAAVLAALTLLTAAGTTGAYADESTPTTGLPAWSDTWPLGSTDTGTPFADTGNLDSLFASALTTRADATPPPSGLDSSPTVGLGPLLFANQGTGGDEGTGAEMHSVACLANATRPEYDDVKVASVTEHAVTCSQRVPRIRMSSFQSGDWVDTLDHFARRKWKDCFNAARCEDHLEVPFPKLVIGTVRSGTSAEIWLGTPSRGNPDMSFTHRSDPTEIGR